MRFEAKHLYFKNIARTIKNFKNLPLSLVKRHQSMECVASIQIDEERSRSCPFWSDIALGKGRMLHGNDKDYAINTITRFYELEKSDMSDSPQVYQYNSVTVYGTQ